MNKDIITEKRKAKRKTPARKTVKRVLKAINKNKATRAAMRSLGK